jgi:hypothetical protein
MVSNTLSTAFSKTCKARGQAQVRVTAHVRPDLLLRLPYDTLLLLSNSSKSLPRSAEPAKPPPEPESAEAQRARARKALTTEPSHVRAFKRKQALQRQEPAPPLPSPPPAKRGLPSRNPTRDQENAPAAPNADVSKRRADAGVVPAVPPPSKRPRPGVVTSALAAAGERLGAEGRLVVPPPSRAPRSRARALVKVEGESDGEERGGVPGDPGPPLDKRKGSKPFARRKKKFIWTGEDIK